MKKPLLLLLVALVLPTAVSFAQISVRTALADDRTVTAGSTYDGTIEVWNETDEFQQAKVYQTDYTFNSDGANHYGEPGRDERSNAHWTRMSTGTITLPPRAGVSVAYQVQVPDTVDGAPVSGSYWSMVMVEGIPKESMEATVDPVTGEPRYPVMQITRYGIQVATHIAGTGDGELVLSEGQFSRGDDSGFSFGIDVENTGSRMLHPDFWAELYQDDGRALGRRDGVQSRIYPGTSVHQSIKLGDLEPGTYRMLVIANAGVGEVYGSEYRLLVE